MLATFVLRDETHLKRLDAFLRGNWLAAAQAMRPLSVTVAEYKARRSGQQNRLYWSILRQIAQDGWVGGRRWDEESWHEYFRRKFIGAEEIVLPGGEMIERGISTTTLNVSEFSDYIEQVIGFAVEELGLEIVR